jgi:hypothetical protein
MTFFELIRGCFRKKTNQGIESYFKDPEVEKMFVKFCETEYSLENILCYQDIREFKKSLKDPMLIYHRYLNGSSSVMEVNVPRRQCHDIDEKLKSGQFDAHLFDSIEGTVITNMIDTLSRFVFDGSYVKYMVHQRTEKQLIEGK